MTDAVTSPSLAELARSGDAASLEKTWLEEMAEPGDLNRYVRAVDALIDTGNTDRVGSLAGMLIESLTGKGRGPDMLAFLEHVATAGVEEVSGIGAPVAEQIQSAYGSEPWFDWMIQKSGATLDSLSWTQFRSFARCAAFMPGKAVLHRSGWGDGLIADLHPDRDEVEIHFSSGKQHTVPWQSALDTMDPLPSWDIRAMRLRNPEDLADLVKEDPLEIIRRALKIFRGKSNASQMKELLHERVVPAKSWAGWWKKAKKAAIEDPLIAVEGSATRPTFTVRKKALTLAEEARASLKHEKRIEQLLTGLRSYLDRATRDTDREQLADYARERLGGLAASGTPDADTVQALLFLQELDQVTEEQAAEVIAAFLKNPEAEAPNYRQLAAIPDSNLRCRIVEMLPRVFGETWYEAAASQLGEIPEECEDSLELLVEMVRAEKAPDLLRQRYDAIAPFPVRHPFLIYLLTKAYAEGDLETDERPLDPNVVCRVILHVLRIVGDGRGSRARRTRLQSRIVTIMIGKRGILPNLLERIDLKTLESALKTTRSGGEDFPSRVQEAVDRVVRERMPELLTGKEVPIWEDESYILSTKQGYEARQDEFLHLRNVLIPENSDAIGAAAKLGDLSENAEWEAAMEEQRNLTAKATEWEEELKRVQFLEETDMPEGCVVPGSRVRLKDLDQNEEKTLRILGPWDGVLGDDVVSYRAPLAASLLGRAPEDEVDIELPSGAVRMRVIEIERLF